MSVSPLTKCSICLDSKLIITSSNVMELTCGHQFHEDCVRTWLNRQSSCPLCRQQIIKTSPQKEPGNAMELLPIIEHNLMFQ